MISVARSGVYTEPSILHPRSVVYLQVVKDQGAWQKDPYRRAGLRTFCSEPKFDPDFSAELNELIERAEK